MHASTTFLYSTLTYHILNTLTIVLLYQNAEELDKYKSKWTLSIICIQRRETFCASEINSWWQVFPWANTQLTPLWCIGSSVVRASVMWDRGAVGHLIFFWNSFCSFLWRWTICVFVLTKCRVCVAKYWTLFSTTVETCCWSVLKIHTYILGS